jgi:tetratricopeptide (TPR) repeat protein/predicted Ser/Thr protein kinase
MPSPDRVGPYVVRARLGAGGMGEVFLADDTRLRRQVALKSVSEKWAREPAARRRLLREARAAAALNHPGIAAVYDVLEPGDSAYIVMEYVPGETLAQKLVSGPLSPQTVLFVGVQLCEALAAAHAHGILHRDIKPSNVALTPDGRLKVLDFGLARSLSSADSDDSAASRSSAPRGRIAGTPAYIPPERYEGAPPSETEDVYSTGVLLYELLSGKRPFVGADVPQVAAAILDGRPVPLRSVAPGVPGALASVIERAMARRPGDRQPTAAALRADLERVRAFGDVETKTAGAIAGPRRWPLAWPAGLSAVAALLALGLGHGAAGRAPSAAPLQEIPVVLVLPLANATGRPADDSLGTGVADVVVAALARIPKVNVLSLAAGRECARERRDLDCALAIGANYVLEGSLQRQRDEVRVTLSLVNGTSRLVAWSETYDGALGDLFDFQRTVAAGVATALRRHVEASGERSPRLALSERAFADYAEALRLLERRDEKASVDRAIALLDGVVAAEPRFALARAALGRAHWLKFEDTKDVEASKRAEAALAAALDLEPDLPGVLVAQAMVLKTKGQLSAAEAAVRRAIAAQPDGDEPHALLGAVLVAQGRVDEGLAELRRSIELRPGFWQHHDAVALAEYSRGHLEEAVAGWRKVVALRPESAWGYVNLGSALYGLGDRAGARESLEKAVLLQPDADALSNLGFLAYEEKRYAAAADAFRRAVALQPKDAGLHRNLGDALARLGRGDDAVAEYREAVELQRQQVRVRPDSGSALARLALFEAKAGDHAAAGDHARAALGREPQSGDVAYLAAVAYALSHREVEGLAALQSAMRLGYNREVLNTDEDLAPLRNRLDGKAQVSRTVGTIQEAK